jgi:hypothetical protein
MKGAKQGVNTHVVRMVAGMRVLDPDKGCAENGFGYWFDNMCVKTLLGMLQFDIVCGQKKLRQQCVKHRQSVVPKSFFKTSRI